MSKIVLESTLEVTLNDNRAGKLAFIRDVQNDLGLNENQEILGYLYVGTETGVKKKIPELDIDDFVSYL